MGFGATTVDVTFNLLLIVHQKALDNNMVAINSTRMVRRVFAPSPDKV
jgi:hypothetical protein